MDNLRERIRERYGRVARQARGGACGPAGCEPISGGLYAAEEAATVPAEALAASLGCGNPTALADLRPGEVVLDLGSGGGADALLAARRVGPGGRVYGLDMTDEMLALARDNARRAGVGNVEFLKGEIESVPLPDASVDVVVSNCVINLSADKPRVLREAFRVLRPGGRFAVSDIVIRGPVPPELRGSVEAWIGCVAGALEEAEYRTLLAAAGFVDVDLEPTRIYGAEDLRAIAAAAGLDPDRVIPLVEGRIMSAFVRARKPGPREGGTAGQPVELGPARPEDLAEVLGLLGRAGLPPDGVAGHVTGFLVARAAGRLVGVVGLELYGASALLRSLAVAPEWQGRGLGTTLARRALEAARARGVERVFLLTTTAADFFRRLGFRPVGREEVDPAVRGSAEFAAACCQTAVVMRLDLPALQVPLVPRVHVHLAVADLARSQAFYERFLGVSPVKVRPGYVKFLPPWAPLNLALSQEAAAGLGRGAHHLGIQLGSRAEVLAHRDRVREVGLALREEIGVDCCHANQDKFWIRDPDGAEWEVYCLNYDLPEGSEAPARPGPLPLTEAPPGCCGR